MFSARSFSRMLLVPAMMAAVAGCSGEPPLAQTPPVEVVVSQSVQEKVADRDIYTGTVQAKDSVDLRSRVRGHIKDVVFKDGQEVSEGKELFLIDSEPFQADLKQAEGELGTWQAKLKLAEDKIALYKPLVEKGTIAKEEYLQAVASQGEAMGGIDSARGKIRQAKVNIEFCTISSPIAGKVGEALLTKGNLVNAGGGETLLTTVVAVDPMYFYFNVNERALLNYLRILRAQGEKKQAAKEDATAKAEIPVEMALVNDVGFPHKGVVDFIDNRVDPATGSIKIRARFDNPKGADGRRLLTDGLFARVRLVVGDPYQAILVADRAILADQSLKYVLVVNKAKNNVVERVDIITANRVQDDGLRVVEAGLKGDEWVIVEGVNRARPGVNVAPKDAPMPRRPAP